MKTLKEQYETELRAKIKAKQNYSNDMQIPRLVKININFGLGASGTNAKTLENAIKDCETIAGQKPVITRAKKSIAAFKLREDAPVGLKVTLRQDRMYHFFAKLVHIALPRVRDFQGISIKGFDSRGNLTIGFKEQLIFPEIQYDKVDAVRGMDITFVTTAKTDKEGKALLETLGMPFKRNEKWKEDKVKVAA